MSSGSGARRVAAVDMGTNSTRLLIADLTNDRLAEIERVENVTGLGRGVDSSGRLSADAISRTTRVLKGYGRRIRETGVEAARAVATSAARDAANQAELVEAARRALGFRAEIIGGEEEARLAFAGATAGTPDPTNTVVVDIGGGSTEVVTDAGAISTDIGSIRLTERCLPRHPAGSADLARARREAARTMGDVDLPSRSRGMGVAGTWTSLAAIHLKLESYTLHEVEGTTLHLEDVVRMTAWLGSMSLEEKETIPSLNPMRAPIILGGAVVAESSLRLLALDRIAVTRHDILDGVCLSLAGPA